MNVIASRRPDHHHHKTRQKSDRLDSALAVVGADILHRQVLTGEDMAGIRKIQTSFLQRALPFCGIEGDP
jgi:hypothetical protein